MDYTRLDYREIKEESITGRYITNNHIFPFLDSLSGLFLIKEIGKSVLGKPIKMVSVGTGPIKILMWSQMHGNESTTTKAVVDLLNYLKLETDNAKEILAKCTLSIIPILNPDGAEAYTRVNANEIDLNRDAQDRSQPESQLLRSVYNDFQPDFCFNLHDQRTIFNVGTTSKPATVSFLAPAFDGDRNISESRKKSMQIIVAMNNVLQKLIPDQIGRYDDGFNANCVGDAFQMLETPTILFESGHSPSDYTREQTREYIFYALLTAINTIQSNEIDAYSQSDYFKIPENGKQFVDIIIHNAHIIDAQYAKGSSLGLLYVETLKEQNIIFMPKIVEIKNMDVLFGHKVYNCVIKSDLDSMKQNTGLWNAIN